MATMFLLCTVLLPLPKCVDEVHHVLRLCRLAVQIAEALNEIDVRRSDRQITYRCWSIFMRCGVSSAPTLAAEFMERDMGLEC